MTREHAGPDPRVERPLGHPGYPQPLLDYLVRSAPGRQLAWDCATGDGKVAHALAARFQRVLATDPATGGPRATGLDRRVELREAGERMVSLPAGSVDLITVADGLHRLDPSALFEEARRVLRRDGVLAIWGLGLPEVTPAVDAALQEAFAALLGWWPHDPAWVREGYAGLASPLDDFEGPRLAVRAHWTGEQFAAWVGGWPASRAAGSAGEGERVSRCMSAVRAAWNAPDRVRLVTWPVHLRAGRARG